MATMSETITHPQEESFGCMEVWGGRRPAHQAFSRPGLDVAVWSQTTGPNAAGGGDLYYMSSCASGRITRTLVADICASGTVFQQLAVSLRSLMMRNVNAIQQTRFVQAVTQQLADASSHGGYASVLVSTYFAPTRSFTLCNAGHPPPLLFLSRQRRWEIMRGTAETHPEQCAALGVLAAGEYQHYQTRLEPGDIVLTYSDVLTECRDAADRVLGVSGLLDLLRSCDAQSPTAVVQDLAQRVRGAHAGNLAGEDTTLLACQATKTPVGCATICWRPATVRPRRQPHAVEWLTLRSGYATS